MKLGRLAQALVLALGSPGVFAAGGPLDLSSGSAGFVGSPSGGAFTDIYTFTLPTAATLAGIVTSVANGGQDIDFTSLTLTGPSGPLSFSLINPDPFETWTLSTPLMAPGAYTLTLAGSNSPAAASYSGNLAVAAIPEPESYALMLAGLAVVAFVVVRRRKRN